MHSAQAPEVFLLVGTRAASLRETLAAAKPEATLRIVDDEQGADAAMATQPFGLLVVSSERDPTSASELCMRARVKAKSHDLRCMLVVADDDVPAVVEAILDGSDVDDVVPASVSVNMLRLRILNLMRCGHYAQSSRRVSKKLQERLRALSDIGDIAFHARSVQELMENSCALLVDTRGYTRAWSVLSDESGAARLVAFKGDDRHERSVSLSLSGAKPPPCGAKVLHDGKTVGAEVLEPVCSRCVRECKAAPSVAAPLGDIDSPNMKGWLCASFGEGLQDDSHEVALFNEIARALHQAYLSIEARRREMDAVSLLGESEKRFEVIYNRVSEGIAVVRGPSLRIVDANPALCTMTGRSIDALSMLRLTDVVANSSLDTSAMRNLKGDSFKGSTATGAKIARPDGSELSVDFSANSIVLSEQPCLLVVFRDVTHREAEESKRQASQRLEAIGRLASGVAHDFNNILAVISSYGEFLVEEFAKDDPARDDALEILRASERAANLTKQLLAFSRRQVASPVVLDVNACIADTERMLRRIIGEDVNLSTALDPRLGNVLIDSGQVEQIFMNLAVNSRDAMPQGGHLQISTTNVQLGSDDWRGDIETVPAGPYIEITVSDDGIGIAADISDDIFEPFFTTKKDGEGTGLGLSTVYGIVRQNNGIIRLNPHSGSGASFSIYLPKVDMPLASEQQSPDSRTESEHLGGEHLLVVEDDEMVRRGVERILRRAGYQVQTADSGKQAQQVVSDNPDEFELIITDIVMPGCNGLDLIKILRKTHKNFKALFMSGYADGVVAQHGILPSDTLLLEKPFSRQGLLDMVRKALEAD